MIILSLPRLKKGLASSLKSDRKRMVVLGDRTKETEVTDLKDRDINSIFGKTE